MIERLPTPHWSTSLRIRLWVIAALTILCTVILASLSTWSWYAELRQARSNGEVINEFKELLDASNVLSAERGPANAFMAGPASDQPGLREDWMLARQRTDAAIAAVLGTEVPQDLEETLQRQLQHARQLVLATASRPPEDRGYDDVHGAITAMFRAHDAIESIIRHEAARIVAASPELIDMIYKGMMLADLREQAGRLGSYVIAPLVAGEPIRPALMIESQAVRGRLMALWLLLEPLATTLPPAPDGSSYLDRTREEYILKGLALRDRLVQAGHRPHSGPALDPVVFSRLYVKTMRPLEDLRRVMIEQSLQDHDRRVVRAQNGMLWAAGLTVAIFLLIVALVISLQRSIFNPLMDASRSIIALAFDQPAPAPARQHHVAEIRLVHSALEVVADKLNERRRMTEELHLLATTDGLTGLLNRRTIDGIGDRTSESQRASDVPHLILADIDHFKHINDRFGHPAGDEVLRELAQVLRRTVRATDHVARFGGEEFAVLLEGVSRAEAALVARKLRKAVRAMVVRLPDGRDIRLTVSFGVAGGRGLAWGEIVRRADQALYTAKQAGRDRIRLG
ncbi:GGDEF domain-containing protein [Pannonibacter tanglangensis]|uniref:diguanylate cyclase n=1 Tax=Pannonibacter tanglangensis TaxID=2750084 RepID=A0ABW9ZDP8_9HYPH|nr:GGDEF domain-containing protein [Pannonibacter sp. XCT-34]NBN62959.1 diguanylate cyclase [Pannonibacter sp. XCT-34]